MTPRTDKIAHAGYGSEMYITHMTELARELERENAQLRETLNRTHRAYLCLQGVNEKQAAKTADAMFQVSLPNVKAQR